LQELLADRALVGLAEDEEREFERLLLQAPSEANDEVELAAASLDLSYGVARFEKLPPGLRGRIESDAHEWLASRARALAPQSAIEPRERWAGASTRSPRWGWWAAAAGFALALFGWWPKLAPRAQAPEEERLALLSQPGVLRAEWQSQPIAQGAAGDVVWSNGEQRGYLWLRGLPRNDPRIEQYQLWIVDAAQEQPIDGGVFDAPREGELVVPIDAKLAVADPQWFAVTLEKPGGVVVSKQERVALVARL